MINGKIVCIRVSRHYYEEKPWAYIGKVRQFSENWVGIEAKAISVARGQTTSIEIDEEFQAFLIPRESIASIRVLPDKFDLSTIQVDLTNTRLNVLIEGAAPCFVGDVLAPGAAVAEARMGRLGRGAV